MLARAKANPFETVHQFASKVLIPASLSIIQGKNEDMTENEFENKCKHCGKHFATQDALRDHIDDEHVRIENLEENEIDMREIEEGVQKEIERKRKRNCTKMLSWLQWEPNF